MEIFKNKVGRPSNETLSKRKKIKMLMIISAILVLGLGGVLIYKNFFVGKEVTSNNLNAAQNPISYRVKGFNGGLNVKGKYYDNKTWISEGTIGNAWVLGNQNAQTKAEIEISFAREIYTKSIYYTQPTTKKAVGDRRYYLYSVVTYNSSGKEIAKTNPEEIKVTRWTGNSVKYGPHYKTVAITSNVAYAKIILYAPKITTVSDAYGVTKPGLKAAEKTIYFAPAPTITVTKAGEKIESDYDSLRSVFTKTGTYKASFKINNPNKITGYYRWITFPNYETSTPGFKGECVYTAGNVSSNPTLQITTANPERKGRIEFYRTYDSCQKRTGAASAFNVYYELKRTSRTSDGFNQLNNFNINTLSSKIGTQYKSKCFSAAMAYGVYIISGGQKIASKSLTSDSAFKWSGYTVERKYYKNDAIGMWNYIRSKIDKGLPLVIHTKSTGTHYVTIYAYKSGYVPSSKSDWGGLAKNIKIIDPYYGNSYYNSYKVTLKHGIASQNSRAYPFYGDGLILSWKK